MMKLVTRTQWGARSPRKRVRGTLSAESTCHWNGPKITIGGKTTWDHSRCAGLVRGIQNYHMDAKEWSDIAYNYVECPHGYTFEGRGLNIVNGANGTNSGNRSSHAICCLAGEDNPFPQSEKVGFKACVVYISQHTLAPNTCKGHRDHKSTECPGDERYQWVHDGMPVSSSTTPTPTPVPNQEAEMLFLSPAKSIAALIGIRLILVVDNTDGTSAAERMQLKNIQDGLPSHAKEPIPCDVVFWRRLTEAYPLVK